MAKKPNAKPTLSDETEEEAQDVNIARFLSTAAKFDKFRLWIVGDSPLICHSWTEKAKLEMLSKQVKAIKPAKEAREPEKEFINALYKMKDGAYGFPATAIKKCLLSMAHKDKGIPQTAVMRSLWISAPYVSIQAAMRGAVCDLPLVRIYGSKPEMREDMTRIGAGLRKTATLSYRAQFKTWAIRISGRFNASVINGDVIRHLINEAGVSTGIGDWRNEKSGSFGMFHLADAEEEQEWTAFAAGKGKLPKPRDEDDYLEAAE